MRLAKSYDLTNPNAKVKKTTVIATVIFAIEQDTTTTTTYLVKLRVEHQCRVQIIFLSSLY